MPHAEALAPALLERVLSKLGLSEPPSPTLEGLRTLYPAWCRKVPFDNIRQLMHRRRQTNFSHCHDRGLHHTIPSFVLSPRCRRSFRIAKE